MIYDNMKQISENNTRPFPFNYYDLILRYYEVTMRYEFQRAAQCSKTKLTKHYWSM